MGCLKIFENNLDPNGLSTSIYVYIYTNEEKANLFSYIQRKIIQNGPTYKEEIFLWILKINPTISGCCKALTSNLPCSWIVRKYREGEQLHQRKEEWYTTKAMKEPFFQIA